MALVQVVTDSLADIPEPMAQELGIHVVPTIVHFGEQSFRDKVELSADEFYRRLASSPVLPKTSQPPPSDFEELYCRLAAETDQIISIHTAAGLTGIYSSALTASQAVSGPRIAVIDSRQVTMALGWLVIAAARAARAGMGLDEIQALVTDMIPRAHVIAMLDTLVYAQRGGRLGKATVLLGTLLNVKPIIRLEDEEVQPVENVRTRRRGIERIAQLVVASGPVQHLAVCHAAARESAEELKNVLAQALKTDDIVIGETGPVIGTHVGPNAVGACWVNGKI